MANQEHLDILRQGVEVWNKWREENPSIQPNLHEADIGNAYLREANLNGADFSKANLREANFNRAALAEANFTDANLTRTDFYRANLTDAVLTRAELWEANLTEAILTRADFFQANLNGANLSKANLYKAMIIEANLRSAVIVNADLREATLRQCPIYGISVWNVKLEGTKQESLVITDGDEPTITVDNLEVAQFIYLLLNHKKLRDVFNTMTERGVLILGRFGGGGLEVLQAIAAKLREENYLPIIFDFERPRDRNYTETVKTLAGLARFVIADLSGPSVPQELYATVPHFKIPFVPIIEAGKKPFAMSVDLLEYPWVVRPPVTFATTEDLIEQLPTKVIAPAEEKHQARQKLLDELFNKS